MRTVTLAGRTLAAFIVLTLAGACDSDTDLNGPGRQGTRVLLTDAPFPYDEVARVDVYIVSVDASATADTTDPARQWTNIVTPRQRFNLLDLQRGATAIMGDGALEAGAYLAVRVVIDTDSSSVTLANGAPATVQWPIAGELALHALVEEPLAVPAGGSEIVIDFDVGRSFWPYGWEISTFAPGDGPHFIFVPWIRAVNEAATGGIVGRLVGDTDGDGSHEPIPNGTVEVMRGDLGGPLTWWTVATGATDTSGDFKIDFLLPGTYIVRGTPPRTIPLGSATAPAVTVVQGTDTDVPLSLSAVQAGWIEIVGPSEVEVGEEIMLRAVVFDALGDTLPGQAVAWLLQPPDIADLYDQNGAVPTGEVAYVRGLQQGVVSIAASSFDLFDSTSVRVIDPNAPGVHTVELSPSSAAIQVFDSLTIAATLRDEQGNVLWQRSVAWTVSDPAAVQFVFTSPDSAIVIGTAPGNATVTATSDGKSGTAAVAVSN